MEWCGIVKKVCTYNFWLSSSGCVFQSLWLTIMMVMMLASSLVVIMTQYSVSRVVLCSVGQARLVPIHFEDLACHLEPNRMCMVWIEL